MTILFVGSAKHAFCHIQCDNNSRQLVVNFLVLISELKPPNESEPQIKMYSRVFRISTNGYFPLCSCWYLKHAINNLYLASTVIYINCEMSVKVDRQLNSVNTNNSFFSFRETLSQTPNCRFKTCNNNFKIWTRSGLFYYGYLHLHWSTS